MYYAGATPPRPDPGHLLSVIAGVSKRVAIETPKPDRKLLRKFKRFVEMWLRHESTLKPLENDEIYTFDKWIETAPYSQARKVELTDMWDGCGRVATDKQLRTVKCFVKDESYDVYKFCRGIYSRSDYAKCLFGPLVASVSDKVFDLDWFIKKIPVVDRPAAIYNKLHKEGKHDYQFTDYTAFESHFTPELMRSCENILMNFMFKNASTDYRTTVQRFCRTKMGKQNMVFRSFNASQLGGRMSGEMDTSLSNGFTNLMLYLFASKEAGCEPDKVKGFFEGDDGIARNDGPAPEAEIFEKLGMTIKIGTTRQLTRASFCGQVYDVEEGVVVTDPREAACRFGWTNKTYVNANDKVLLELLKAKGYSFVYQYGSCPILGKLGAAILRLTSHINVRDSIRWKMDEWERTRYDEARDYLGKHGEQVGTPGPNTRNMVETMFHVSAKEQEDIEESLDAMTELGPLPFQFKTVPQEWTSYYRSYATDRIDSPPVWVNDDSRGLLKQLVQVGALNDFQAHCLRGA